MEGEREFTREPAIFYFLIGPVDQVFVFVFFRWYPTLDVCQ